MNKKENFGKLALTIVMAGIVGIILAGVAGAATITASTDGSVDYTKSLSNSGAESWLYHRNLSISNPGGDLTNYQVLVNLTDSNFPIEANNSGADIRFTDASNTELNYWIENWDYADRSGKIWVKVTSIPAGGTTILMWYGNPRASSSSNGDTTFLLFDDFNSLAGWSILNGGGAGSASSATFDGVSVAQLNSVNFGNRITIAKPFQSSNSGMLVETKAISSRLEDGILIGFTDGTMRSASDDGPINGAIYAFIRNYNSIDYLEIRGGGGGLISTLSSGTANTWYTVGLSWLGDNFKGYRNRIEKLSGNDAYFSHQNYIHISTATSTIWNFDWILVRKYVFAEPSVNVSTDIPLSTPPTTTIATISGFKINSSDGSGIQDWNITLANSTMQNSMLTDSDGSYKFMNLVNGTYTITEEIRMGWINVSPISQEVTINGVDITNVNFTNQLLAPNPIEITPPNTTVVLAGTLGNNGWYISDVQVNLSAADDEGGTGVNLTEYSFDNVTWNTYVDPINITIEGTTTLYYRSTDNAGNIEETKNQTISIDKTKPDITGALITAPNANGWYTANVIAHFTGSDAVSGLNPINDITLSTEGSSQSITGTAMDKAGNSNSTTILGINLDKTPSLTTVTLNGTLGNNGWYVSDVEVTLTATDSVSGVAMTEYSFDNANWNTYTVPFNVTSEGATTIYYRSIDNAGNIEMAIQSVPINIDKTPPTITESPSSPPNGNGWYNGDVTINFTGSDSGSCVESITPDTTLSGEGSGQTVTASVTDCAGHTTTKSITISIDKTPPVITINIPTEGANYLLNENVNADYSATDTVSGIDTVTGTVPNGTQIDTSTVGPKTFTVTATDKAGNQASQTVTYNVVYGYCGIQPPIKEDGTSVFKLGSTIPVKFCLTDFGNNYIATAAAKIYLTKISDNIAGTEEEANSTSNATTGNLFRYDTTDNQYIFNLATKDLTTGTYQIRIELDDRTNQYAKIGLR